MVKQIFPEIESIDQNHFTITIQDKEAVPQLVEKLVNKQIKIYSIKEKEISLEDAFLKKTGGNIID